MKPTLRRGFTLIELLVVVAIIALLISILLPSLSRAREQSRATLCMSNLKQVGLGFYYYMEDNNDRPPPNRLKANADAPYGGTPPEFKDSDWWYYEHMVSKFIPSDKKSQTNAAFGGVFKCPSDLDSGRAYSMNIFAGDYDRAKPYATNYTRGTPFNPLRVPESHQYLLFSEAHAIFEDSANPGMFGTRYVIGQDGSSLYRKFMKAQESADRGPFYGYVNFNNHGGEVNLLFADQHVERVSQKQIVMQSPEDPARWISTLKVRWSPDDPTFNLPTPP